MKYIVYFLFFCLFISCSSDTPNETIQAAEKEITSTNQHKSLTKPTVSFTFDDGITKDIVNYKFADWNQMILDALAKHNLKATFFVTGANKRDQKGKFLLNTWSDAGHQIANHTFTHPNFNNEKISVEDFTKEFTQTDAVIKNYKNYTKLFRFPYLKEGNTKEKVEGFRQVLQGNGYRNGHVSIDASDWYVNNELINSIRKDGPDNPDIEKYKAFYIQHILDRAAYYENLAFDMTGRHISHTLLLHHNLSSALFLDDLIQAFQDQGWALADSEKAFQDEIFTKVPTTIPAGESIIWALAKETGKYEDQLRYPAEDSRYERPKLKALGLLP